MAKTAKVVEKIGSFTDNATPSSSSIDLKGDKPEWLAQAYEGSEFLNPEHLRDEKLTERLPNPSGYRMLVLPYRGKRKTGGGILFADETMERKHIGSTVGYVLKQGPLCYQDDKFKGPDGELIPWCQPGDWVLFARYAGARMNIDGGEVRIMNDDEIMGTIMYPDDIYGAI